MYKKILLRTKMEFDIVNFLPKYPNIEQFDVSKKFLNTYDEDFYKVIYKKKEFYENRLENLEEIPKSPGNLMNHQKLIARFFSSNTLYDELLLLHEMGTGKSCSAVGAIEQIREEGMFKGALYFAKGEALINNFTNELIFKCTDGRYIPEEYQAISELKKVHRKKKAIKDYYQSNTFETFAKKIKLKKSQDELEKWCENFNNHIIIIDEVHNLRMKTYSDTDEDGKKSPLNVYDEFWRFLHAVKNCKILLMSGTPMKDGVDEIASVMNLILPKDKQMKSGEEFVKDFFIEKSNSFKVKPSYINELKKVFKGRVSYLKAMQSSVKKNFSGSKQGELEHLMVEEDKMSTFQTKYYNLAYEEDGKNKGVWSNSRQASLFIFPNGKWGKEGFSDYIETKEKSKKGEEKKKSVFYISPKLRDEIKKTDTDSPEIMLERLSVFSSKYAESIKTILQAQKEDKSVFVYNEFVTGSGVILFGLILELFGFVKASGFEKEGNEKPRYASLTSETSTDRQIPLITERFNKPDNMHGKIINVIIGSRKVSEGFTFKNVQIIDIHTPWFNYSETSQVIARGYRLGSHRDLIDTGINPQLTIYQRVSIPENDEKRSIDLDMYTISENKDISIKGVERIMKESAWDCALTYRRNLIIGQDNTRDCDYTNCYYVCDGCEGTPEDITEFDYSSFNLKYNDSNIQVVIDKLIILFRTNFRLELTEIIEQFPDLLNSEVISALRIIINESKKIINKYGFPSYLKEHKNIFFLVDGLSSSETDYYTEHPHLKNPISFNYILEMAYDESLPKIINTSLEAKSTEDIRKLMNRLPIEIQEYFLESSIKSDFLDRENLQTFNSIQERIRKLILKYFEKNYLNIDGVWISWLLEDTFRCFNEETLEWTDCDPEHIQKVELINEEKQKKIQTNIYNFHGLYNNTNRSFCLRDTTNSNNPELKGHQQTSGRVCVTMKKEDLINLAINIFKFKIPTLQEINQTEKELLSLVIAEESNLGKMKKILAETNKQNNKQELLKILEKHKYVINPELLKDQIDELKRILRDKTIDELKCIYFWSNQTNKTLCGYMHIWLKNNKFYFEDETCNSSVKRKPKTL
jgi:hypothetical protein